MTVSKNFGVHQKILLLWFSQFFAFTLAQFLHNQWLLCEFVMWILHSCHLSVATKSHGGCNKVAFLWQNVDFLLGWHLCFWVVKRLLQQLFWIVSQWWCPQLIQVTAHCSGEKMNQNHSWHLEKFPICTWLNSCSKLKMMKWIWKKKEKKDGLLMTHFALWDSHWMIFHNFTFQSSGGGWSQCGDGLRHLSLFCNNHVSVAVCFLSIFHGLAHRFWRSFREWLRWFGIEIVNPAGRFFGRGPFDENQFF